MLVQRVLYEYFTKNSSHKNTYEISQDDHLSDDFIQRTLTILSIRVINNCFSSRFYYCNVLSFFCSDLLIFLFFSLSLWSIIAPPVSFSHYLSLVFLLSCHFFIFVTGPLSSAIKITNRVIFLDRHIIF